MSLPTLGWLTGLLNSSAALPHSAPLNVAIDSRKIKAGQVFWALRGTRDGHEFVAAAFQKGCVAAVVHSEFAARADVDPARLIRVPDPLAALTDAARAWRNELRCHVIGVTGSVGKTTAKDFLHAAFEETSTVQATSGNFNNEIGVPLTLLDTNSHTEVLVCEMGAARIGDIKYLCDIAKPGWGLVTAIAESHIESFKSVENIARTKGELYDFVRSDGVAFVPVNDVRCIAVSTGCRQRIGFGFAKPNVPWEDQLVLGDDLLFDDRGHARFSVAGQIVELAVPGRPVAQAALAAMSVAMHHGVSPSSAARGIARAIPSQGRANVRSFNQLTVIDDSYNANPASMRSALETLSLRQATRKVAVLGDMLELGELSDEAHRDVVEELDRAGVALAVLIGPRFSHVAASYTRANMLIFPSTEEALPTLSRVIRPSDLVLVKASRGMALERVVQKLEELFG